MIMSPLLEYAFNYEFEILTAQMSPPFNAHDQFVIMKPDEIINRRMQMMGKGRSKGDGHSLAQKITGTVSIIRVYMFRN